MDFSAGKCCNDLVKNCLARFLLNCSIFENVSEFLCLWVILISILDRFFDYFENLPVRVLVEKEILVHPTSLLGPLFKKCSNLHIFHIFLIMFRTKIFPNRFNGKSIINPKGIIHKIFIRKRTPSAKERKKNPNRINALLNKYLDIS